MRAVRGELQQYSGCLER